MEISGRNQLAGTIEDIKTGAVMAELTVNVNGQKIVSVITNESLSNMNLKTGDSVKTLIKSTDVMIMK